MFSLSFKAYSRPLTQTLRMSRGEIKRRNGVIVRLENGDGQFFYGEAVTLPYFGTETAEDSIEILESLNGKVSFESLSDLKKKFPATCFALESAMILAEGKLIPREKASFPLSKLVHSMNSAQEEVQLGINEGYTTFKWKIGIEDIDSELEVLHQLLSTLPKTCSLRLDANGGLNLEQANIWLKACESTQVEFIEQPLLPEKIKETISLQEKTTTPISLDESMASTEEMINCYNLGWRGVYVVKVSRLRELRRFIEWREANNIDVIYSSALETSIGTELSIQVAANDSKNKRALGYGVSHWFHDDGLYLHENSARLCALDENENKFAQVWRAIKG